MKIRVTLKDIDKTEIIDVENPVSRNSFDYIDSYGANNHLEVFDDGITIERYDIDHKTKVTLRKESYIQIISEEGTLTFLAKIVEFNKNFDIITIVYSVDDNQKEIIINYLGV